MKTEIINAGHSVQCDICGEDFTESQSFGGFVFGSKAYCPTCARAGESTIREFHEEHLIRARARQDETFGDFVRRYRLETYGSEDAIITITAFD